MDLNDIEDYHNYRRCLHKKILVSLIYSVQMLLICWNISTNTYQDEPLVRVLLTNDVESETIKYSGGNNIGEKNTAISRSSDFLKKSKNKLVVWIEMNINMVSGIEKNMYKYICNYKSMKYNQNTIFANHPTKNYMVSGSGVPNLIQ